MTEPQTRRGAILAALAVSLAPSAAAAAPGPGPALTGHEHDWDWLVGRWNVRHHRLKARLAGTVAVSGPKLAASLTELGLIDEYRLYYHPAVLGHGAPFFAGPTPPLRLVATDHVGEDTIRLTYVPA